MTNRVSPDGKMRITYFSFGRIALWSIIPKDVCHKLTTTWAGGRNVDEIRQKEEGVPSDFGPLVEIPLGQLTYVPSRRQLLDAQGDTVYLRPQTEKTLALLIERIGELVPRDTLIETIWPDLNVTDDSLTQCIADIRRAIGDSKRTILQTVPKRGFILNYPSGKQHRLAAQSAGFAEAAAPFETKDAAVVHLQGDAGQIPLAVTDGTLIVDRGQNHLTLVMENLPQALRRAVSGFSNARIRAGIDVTGNSAAAARDMAALAKPGETIVSVDVKEVSEVAAEFDFEDIGDVALKTSGQEKRLFRASSFDLSSAIQPRLLNGEMLPTIAVISPRPIAQEGYRGALGDLIADEISGAMSRTREARVISRLSCRPYRLQMVNQREIGNRLGADFVVTGRYRRQGNDVVLDIDLGESRSDDVLHSERYSFEESEIFSSQGVVHEIVSRLRKNIVLNEIERVRSRPIESLNNYTMLWAAVGLMHRLSPSDFNWAKKLLEALIDRAPHHPSALAWMARWHVLKAQQGWSENADEDAALALDCASRALDMDPENSLALVNRGIVLTNLMGRFDDAEDDYNTALALNPNDAHGRLLRGMLYAFQDRGAEGVRDAEQALALAPLDPHRFFFLALAAGANLTAGDYSRTLELTKGSLRLNRTHASTLRMLVVAHQLSGDEEAAQNALKELTRMQPNLTIGAWLRSSPSAPFEVGKRFAGALRAAGLPE